MIINTKKVILIFLLCFSFIASAQVSFDQNDSKVHLINFQENNNNHHDNMDDATLEHSHRHKHSKDSNEHQHSHDHSKITQIQLQFVIQNIVIKLKKVELGVIHSFYAKSFISTPPPFDIFRPPIAQLF